MGEYENDLAIVNPTVQHAIFRCHDHSNLRRYDFPEGFIFGTGTSAYQAEGAAAVDGRGPSIWDDFTLRDPGRITDGSNGNVAVDMYNRYKEDIRTMKAMGLDAYRFSISWPRILPGGRCSAGINRKGIDYYNDLIDTIIAHGMQPCVTLFHWDLPDCLQKEYDGFLSKNIVTDFREFVELCFWEFGDRVKWWTTINEPGTYAVHGYVRGTFPPGKASCPLHRALRNLPAHRIDQDPDAIVHTTESYFDVKYTKYDKSDPAKDVYTVARNLLLAHAAAVHLYKTKFEVFQKGQIGIVLNSHWHVPLNEHSHTDRAAARRAVDFMLGWFLNPVLYGCYPQSMIDSVPPENLAHFTYCESEMLRGQIGIVLNSHWHVPLNEHSHSDRAAARRAVDFMLGWFLNPVLYGSYPQSMIDSVPPENLAYFTYCESEMLRGSTDYVGLNYYTTNYVTFDPCPKGVGYDADQKLKFETKRNGKPIGESTGSSWLKIVPWGIYEHLVYLKKTYPELPPIYITENGTIYAVLVCIRIYFPFQGVSDKNDFKLTAKEACVDSTRTKYHQDHLAYILKAIKEAKVDVRGYFIWSWCDNFEWVEGYKVRFGITYIDFMNNQTRYPKESAVWFAQFLKGRKKIIPLSTKRQIEGDSESVPEKRSKALEE
ncbi:Raucaffricine beta-glucosidase [Handroanthus impetiginosus]|uniref:Raucaffricine beta-glucosidase n=1 Tax=Handroanthus impetiginosus TaxID=429701 RepID=A0A2G9HLV4_9LAMI|nr:Raucaffricine beta-glucosidase [Handroanthus impetiginosus]